MTQPQRNQNVDSSFLNSKIGKLLLTIVSVFLIFAGPTYVVYGLAVIINVDLAVSFVVGFVLFAIGLVMMRYLVKNKVVT
ncbi:MAG: hypothetical protein NWF00_08150 [Candidatus Bathyarchaeota archaeon]|nr:hypothetical protein [Candidatus Bathyarchaeota archaeon]